MKKLQLTLIALALGFAGMAQTFMHVINQSPHDIDFSVQAMDAGCTPQGGTPYVTVPAGTDFVLNLAAPNNSIDMIRIKPSCTMNYTDVNLGNPCFSCGTSLPSSGSFMGLGAPCVSYTFNANWVRCTAPSPQANAVIVN